MISAVLGVDFAAGVATFQGEEVDVAVPVILHLESGTIVWQSPVVVPLILEDWLDRAVGQLSTIHAAMLTYWPEVEAYTDWWLIEPGDAEHPHGLKA